MPYPIMIKLVSVLGMLTLQESSDIVLEET